MRSEPLGIETTKAFDQDAKALKKHIDLYSSKTPKNLIRGYKEADRHEFGGR